MLCGGGFRPRGLRRAVREAAVGDVPQLQQGAGAHRTVRRDGHHEQVLLRGEHDQQRRRAVLRVPAHLEGLQALRLVGARRAGGRPREGEPERALHGDDRPQHAVLGHAPVLARLLHRRHARRLRSDVARAHEGVDARLHRLRREALGRPHRLLHPLRRRHERVVRVRPRAHEPQQGPRLGRLVQAARPGLRRVRARAAVAREGRVREPRLRPRRRGREDRLLAVPQLASRRRPARIRGGGAQGGSEDEGDRRVLRLLPRERQQAHVLRPSRLRARIRLARHRLLHRARQLFGPSHRRRLRQPARARYRVAPRQALPARDRLRPARPEALGQGTVEDARGRPRRQHARSRVRDGEQRELLVVRHVGRVLPQSGGARADRRSRCTT